MCRKANDDIFIVKARKEMDELLKKACSDERLSDGAFRMLYGTIMGIPSVGISRTTKWRLCKELNERGYGCFENETRFENETVNESINFSEPSPMEILARRYRDKMEEQKKW